MNITITFRHLDPSDAVKKYAHDKVGRLQKFLKQPMTAAVTVALEKLDHVIEVRVSAGDGHFHGKEQSEDMYASIDKVVDKIERQIRTAKEARVDAQRSGLRTGDFAAKQTGESED